MLLNPGMDNHLLYKLGQSILESWVILARTSPLRSSPASSLDRDGFLHLQPLFIIWLLLLFVLLDIHSVHLIVVHLALSFWFYFPV
ncbi:hypothetical protein VFPPC_15649 [Pochonia chlamydosporia 170]|uniref:Uncharacterized protein n=1 Tax=Pochonia chlamydosporia 170 TaxID=1380566 RepID=A0A179G057_METCM|nr:hypothetical protein VFPPC_15649 [Pochonia chlamydosporia 170]OAQ71047.1 hypothetical protein VFPPC_15649 [Pochonia chlamydosporia 170]